MPDALEQIVTKLGRDPLLAHRALFKHRHPDATQPFHDQLIIDWHSDIPYIVDFVFRGGAKSTTAEEAICTMACFKRFNNALVIGETLERARERLSAIKHELEQNEDILAIFGDMRGETWQETRIVLANGSCIQAVGSGQSLRGVKHLQYRPDIAFCDDLEDEESVRNEDGRKGKLNWFLKTLMPAMDPKNRRVRVAATPLHPEALALRLAHLQGWVHHKFPICYIDADTGEEVSSWPDRFPMSFIIAERERYAQLGSMQAWQQEYMCEASSESEKLFTSSMIKVEPTVRTWQATYAMYDPARTVKATSATTGKAVWSWVNNKLIIWEAAAELWMPDQIISDMFDVDRRFAPIAIGVERDGLEEFIMQPLRQEQAKRGHPLPIRDLKAPKGKLDFIRSLQPFFKAGEVVFAGDRQQFEVPIAQLLAYPTGKIDFPNALAYALTMRPGLPVYDGFSVQNISEDLRPHPRATLTLAVNATNTCTAAALVQVDRGSMSVLADWIVEADPGMALGEIVMCAGTEAGRTFNVVAPARHFNGYDTVGLRAAARQVPIEVRVGGSEVEGRGEVRRLLGQMAHGLPAFRVSQNASWSLRALTGGYAREIDRRGSYSDEASAGPYKVLCEGLEAFAAFMAVGRQAGDDSSLNWQYSAGGTRFLSALPR